VMLDVEGTSYPAGQHGAGHYLATPWNVRIGFPAICPDNVEVSCCLRQQKTVAEWLNENKISLNQLLEIDSAILIKLLNENNVKENIAWTPGHLSVLHGLAGRDTILKQGVRILAVQNIVFYLFLAYFPAVHFGR
jgi:hypothetical protein